MKDGIVCGGDGASKIDLLRRAWLRRTDKRNGMIEECVNEIHADLRVNLVLQLGLLRLATKVEIGNEIPIILEVNPAGDEIVKS